MATREKRLAQFDGQGEPPPGQTLELLCEDHSGTYQLPFPCLFVDGQWLNQESGVLVEATVVGWRLPRSADSVSLAADGSLCIKTRRSLARS